MTVARIWTSAGWMDLNGAPGLPGPQGPPGGPVPVGGTTDQVLAKASNTDGHVKWVDAGGGAAAVWIDESAPSDPNANLWIDTDEPGVDLQDWAGLDTRVDTLELYQPQYVTSIPATPYAGQEIFYRPAVDQGVWHLRYTAGWGDGYGWEFVGGAPLVDQSSVSVTATTGVHTAGADPLSVTLPLAGHYDIAYGWTFNDISGTESYIYSQVFVNGVAVAVMLCQNWPTIGRVQSGGMEGRVLGIAAGATVLLMHASTAGTTARWNGRWMRATPVRVK